LIPSDPSDGTVGGFFDRLKRYRHDYRQMRNLG
jgi:hypothetical protein